MAGPRLPRRELLAGAASLLGCSTNEPRRGFLGAMDGFTERVQGALYEPEVLARTPPAEESTPEADFPKYKIGDHYPQIPAGWSLAVSGSVSRPRNFSLEDLTRLPRTEVRVRHHCVEGWSAVATWHGVRLRDLAEVVGLAPETPFVEFVSFEPVPGRKASAPALDVMSRPGAEPRVAKATYTSSWDRASALHPQTLLAYGMNGRPLGRLHGGPVRLYSANKLGYKMVKWLQAVRFLPTATGGYWEDQGYEWFAGV